jgi:hypothetical protein
MINSRNLSAKADQAHLDVVDANVLLNFYRYNESTRDDQPP